LSLHYTLKISSQSPEIADNATAIYLTSDLVRYRHNGFPIYWMILKNYRHDVYIYLYDELLTQGCSCLTWYSYVYRDILNVNIFRKIDRCF